MMGQECAAWSGKRTEEQTQKKEKSLRKENTRRITFKKLSNEHKKEIHTAKKIHSKHDKTNRLIKTVKIFNMSETFTTDALRNALQRHAE